MKKYRIVQDENGFKIQERVFLFWIDSETTMIAPKVRKTICYNNIDTAKTILKQIKKENSIKPKVVYFE